MEDNTSQPVDNDVVTTRNIETNDFRDETVGKGSWKTCLKAANEARKLDKSLNVVKDSDNLTNLYDVPTTPFIPRQLRRGIIRVQMDKRTASLITKICGRYFYGNVSACGRAAMQLLINHYLGNAKAEKIAKPE